MTFASVSATLAYARWTKDNFATLAACNPKLPHVAFNRLADNWRPLLAIAQVAGGDWPQRALDAFTKLSAKPTPQDLSLTLLADIPAIFAEARAQRLFSSTLVDSLCTIQSRPWSGTDATRKPITETWLARRLTPLGIRSQTMRIGQHRARGYHLADFLRASHRFSTPQTVTFDSSLPESSPVLDEPEHGDVPPREL